MDTDLFDEIPLFKVLENSDRCALPSHFVLRSHPKNSVIINEGDNTSSLYIILQGRVKIYLSDEAGKEVVLNIEGPGEYFGEVSLLDESPRSASVMTLDDCRFAVLKRDEFIKCLTDNPRLAFIIIQGLTTRLRALSENIRSLALMDVYGRVARLLNELASEHEDGTWVITEPLTQYEIASRIGASTKMVGRIMQDLKKGGYIRKQKKQIIIARHLPASW